MKIVPLFGNVCDDLILIFKTLAFVCLGLMEYHSKLWSYRTRYHYVLYSQNNNTCLIVSLKQPKIVLDEGE